MVRSPSDRPHPALRRGRVAAMVALLAATLTGCSADKLPGFGWPRGVTPQADLMRTLWSTSTIAALVVGVIVWGLIFWSVVRYRHRPDGPELPAQVGYNLPIEVLYTVIPFLIISVLFYYTAIDENFVNKESAKPDVQISVLAFQWNWQFGYVGERDNSGRSVQTVGSTNEVPILVLPVNKTVLFTEYSSDVIHSFFVPDFLFKRDVIPGRTNSFQVTVTRTGSFVGRCAEYCGTYHAMMNFEVRAVSAGDYQRYIADRKQGMTTPEALRDIGQAPYATTTHPFGPGRGQRADLGPANAGEQQ